MFKAKCPIFKAIVPGFRGKVASKNRTLGIPGISYIIISMFYVKAHIVLPRNLVVGYGTFYKFHKLGASKSSKPNEERSIAWMSQNNSSRLITT